MQHINITTSTDAVLCAFFKVLMRVAFAFDRMTLTIDSLSEPDFGLYRCVSKNSFGEAEETIRVYGKYCPC